MWPLYYITFKEGGVYISSGFPGFKETNKHPMIQFNHGLQFRAAAIKPWSIALTPGIGKGAHPTEKPSETRVKSPADTGTTCPIPNLRETRYRGKEELIQRRL